ncbi:MAG: excinuclease ABC subunit UvrC [Alphaproteobacteria bacterium]|nr:excinuclease ABC subunit UvrC [Alphaproteobacteria bacterium]
MSRLDDLAADLPTTPGVYLFKDRKGRVIYVGKAINLRARVKQYLSGQDARQMVPFLVHAAGDLEVVLTTTEKEALLLENTLIKKHRPRFNVKLRDDSNFLHLRLDLSEKWPRYRLVRAIGDDGARYFGPYASAQKARHTLAFLQRIFPLRTCTDATLRSRKRPCLLHQMGRCVAPCVDLVQPAAYQRIAEDSTALLEGRVRGVVGALEQRMHGEADRENFEEAARLRDLIASIRATVERQQVVDPRLSDRDVWGLHREGYRAGVTILPVREGVMTEPLSRVVQGVVEDDDELLSSLLNNAYQEGTPIPGEILVPFLPSDHAALEELLTERRGRKVVLHKPERGNKVRLVTMATSNAAARLAAASDEETQRREALAAVAELVGLDHPPARMECFDNSHLAGTNPVSAMAVFLDGKPARAEYRRYRIKQAMGGDDYGGMREVLTRRLTRGLESGELPDLLVIDGGKGQVGVAAAVLSDLGIDDLPMVGISKPRTEHARGERAATDKLVLPGVKDPIRVSPNHPGLRMLQHLRDQTHDHVVGYQRKVRQKKTLRSALEGIPGVGPSRRRALLTELGSVAGVAAADVDTLAAVPGIGPSLAAHIHATLHPSTPSKG